MNSAQQPKPYIRFPYLHGDNIYFHTDDDIWMASRLGGNARRLTNSHGSAFHPRLSPNGDKLAYSSNDQGQVDIYVMKAEGSIPERITYKNITFLGDWLDNKHLVFASWHESFSMRVTYLYKVNVETKVITPLNLGHATTFVQEGKIRVLAKNMGDPARWKRYRGGTAGTLWVTEKSGSDFKQLLPKLNSNLSNPKVYGGRIYFISDHEGTGNIYSVLPSGRGLKRETHEKRYYVRNFNISQGEICYQSAANVYLKTIGSSKKEATLVGINVPSSFNQSVKRIEDAEDFLQEVQVNDTGMEMAFVTRGQLFTRRPWSDAPLRKGLEDHRYRLPVYIKEKKQNYLLAVELNTDKEEVLRLFSLNKENPLEETSKVIASKQDWGKIEEIKVNPEKAMVAISNNRNELFLVSIPTGKVTPLMKNEYRFYEDFNWSPCGRYLAFMEPESRTKANIHIYDVVKKNHKKLIDSVLIDMCPVFDPEGDYLYFLGLRNFNPIYNETHFDLGFPYATGVFALPLQNDTYSPLELYLDFEDEEEEEDDDTPKEEEKGKQEKSKATPKKQAKKPNKSEEKKSEKKEDKVEETKIDFDGANDRIIQIPVGIGGYLSLSCANDKIFLLQHRLSPSDGDPTQMRMPSNKPSLYTYDLKEKKKELFQKDVYDFDLSLDGTKLLINGDAGVRLLASDAKAPEGESQTKKDGFVSLDNIKLSIDPKKEWFQMYREAWVLQREHFWVADMNKINWEEVYHAYLPILEKVHTRWEFSDLMWEMQGELGTSHCYEFGGDYFKVPFGNRNGDLAASFKWNAADNSFTITEIAHGDSWIKSYRSPLLAPGITLKVGDKILGVDGRAFESSLGIDESLEGRNGQKIAFIIKRKGAKKVETIYVSPLPRSSNTRYRDWVNANKAKVEKLSKGKIGYIHVPDMGVHGYSEFYRNFLSECTKEGLIVDVRYNGGGHISQHLLKVLAQKTIGFDKTRHMGIEPYPMYSINGPIVALTNEHAGSDGDIFSHSFKLMGLGPLIGKRTWGGVVGIWPRHPLNDGTITSQPEFSFWFKDVGYDVENYGTDPDIEVENTPKDWSEGKDKQLETAVKEAMKRRSKNPPLKPNLNQGRPNLRAPKLPN